MSSDRIYKMVGGTLGELISRCEETSQLDIDHGLKEIIKETQQELSELYKKMQTYSLTEGYSAIIESLDTTETILEYYKEGAKSLLLWIKCYKGTLSDIGKRIANKNIEERNKIVMTQWL